MGLVRALRARTVTALVLLALAAVAVLPAPAGAAVTAPADRVAAEAVRARQWQLDTLRVRDAWTYANGQNVVVAVLDSGVDASHPDLSGQVLPGADFVDTGGDGRSDTVGHGTTVAALIAGQDDPTGMVGVAHHAKVLPVRVLDRKNRYRDAGIVAKGLRWAVDHGATVVNMSLGGAQESPELADAIQYAYDHDVVIVACGGNAGRDKRMWYPAREPGVVAVTGLERDGTFWGGSLEGPDSSLSAPATGIVGIGADGYQTVRGTSFAAALVSATAALIRSHWPDMTAANVVNRLIRTARDKGPAGRDDRYGYGVVDPVSALTNPVSSVRENPLDTTPRTAPPSATWQASPAIQTAPATGDGGPWWWVAGAILAATGFGVTAGLVLMIRRRRDTIDASPWHPGTWNQGP